MGFIKALYSFLEALPKLVDLIQELREERIRREVSKRVKQINRDLARVKTAKTDEDRRKALEEMSKW